MSLVLEQKGFPWKRLVAVVVTVLALWLVFRKVKVDDLLAVLKHTHPGWFLAAVAVFGLAVLCAAWRWHLMLRMTKAAVHLLASIRLYFIGFGLGFALLGPAVGDVAKSALYARWFRVPLPPIIAAAPLDRMLGLAGMAIFCAGALVLAAAKGVFAPGGAMGKFHVPLSWVLAGLVAAVAGIIVVFRWRPKSESAIAHTFKSFADVAARLIASPRTALPGLALGFVVQALSCLLLMLCLKAVVTVSCPWAAMLWVFPVISGMTAMPSVGGLGVREAVAVSLLGFYGVPQADALAASLLVFPVNLLWALAGGGLLWREEKKFEKLQTDTTRQAEAKSISVIIPVVNDTMKIAETIRRVRALPEVSEVIVVTGRNAEAIRQLGEQSGWRELTSEAGLGRQLRAGAVSSTGDVILLLPADTFLPLGAGRDALDCLRDQTVAGGGFWPANRWTRFQGFLKLALLQRVQLAQGVFVRRGVLENTGGVPDTAEFDESEFCRRLRREGRLALANAAVNAT